MSKNITIQEGGVARTLSGVEKIVTNVAGESGTQNWVPEDEAANYVSTGELNARENGTYISSDDGYVGYSKVEVNVTPDVGELNVSENGTYYAQDDGYDGFSRVVVDVESGGGGATLITKEITEDGTYDASDDDADGYSSVTVNVGGGGTLISKQITQNGTYNASDDSANGYSSVTVNVSYPHGRVIVDGINHAPVSQRLTSRDFFEDFNEKWFTAIEPYIPSDSTWKLRYEAYVRGGGWIRNNNFSWIYDYNDIAIFAKGGIVHNSNSLTSVLLFLVGIVDETADITICEIDGDDFNYFLYNDDKFITPELKAGSSWGISGNSYFSSNTFKAAIDSHQTGSISAPREGTSIFSNTIYAQDNTPQKSTGWLTNLTGGIIQNIGG